MDYCNYMKIESLIENAKLQIDSNVEIRMKTENEFSRVEFGSSYKIAHKMIFDIEKWLKDKFFISCNISFLQMQ